jgi:chromosomal replication initiation ATPase DnaA
MTVREYTDEVLVAIFESLKLDSLAKSKVRRRVQCMKSFKEYGYRQLKANRPVSTIRKSSPLIPFLNLPEHVRLMIMATCRRYRISESEFCTNSRQTDITNSRSHLMYYMRTELKMTYNKIGAYFMKDHSTAINAFKRHENYMATDKHFKAIYESLKESYDKIIHESI